MRYAVNIYDWMEMLQKPFSPEELLLKSMLTKEVVSCNAKYPDEDSMLVKGDVTEERWNAVVFLLRDKFRHQRNKYRLYESKTGKGGWKRV